MRMRSWIIALVLAVAAVAVHGIAVASGKEFCLTQLTMAIYYAIVVVGICVVMGYAGQISLGHGAFFALGGYTSAVLTTHDFSKIQQTFHAGILQRLHVFTMKEDLFGSTIMVVTPWAAFLVAMLLTALVAAVLGYPALRLRGHYLAMATLGFGLIVYRMVVSLDLTGAADGISGVPEWNFFGLLTVANRTAVRVQNYYAACAFLLIILVLMANMAHSRVGRALLAIHDHETAANATGVNTALFKLKAFVLSAMLAAFAGVLFTHYTGSIGPSEAGAMKSVRYLALAAAGGISNLWSAAIVSTTLIFLSLRDWFGSYDNAVFGAILITIMSIAPGGPLKFVSTLAGPAAARLTAKRGDANVAS